MVHGESRGLGGDVLQFANQSRSLQLAGTGACQAGQF